MTDPQKGVAAMAAAATIWGLSSIYYKALAAVPPLEVLSHRTLWSTLFLLGVLAVQGRAGEAAAALARPRDWTPLLVTALLIAANWLLFIIAVQQGHALEASLGYYIFPLVAVALGYLILGERFTRLQSVAIGLAAAAVLLLTVAHGSPPWTALVLALTFGGYGIVKTRIRVGPVVSVFIETLLLSPLAILWLWGMHDWGWTDIGGRTGGHFGQDWKTSLLLAFSGPLTGAPLMLFSYATHRIPYATVGLVQYLNPTLQFTVAVAVFGEHFSIWQGIAFALIWSGLALYSWDSLRGRG